MDEQFRVRVRPAVFSVFIFVSYTNWGTAKTLHT